MLWDLVQSSGSKTEHPGQAPPPGNLLLPACEGPGPWLNPMAMSKQGHFLPLTNATPESELKQDWPLCKSLPSSIPSLCP